MTRRNGDTEDGDTEHGDTEHGDTEHGDTEHERRATPAPGLRPGMTGRMARHFTSHLDR